MNRLLKDLLIKKEKIAVVGLGYVGLPLAHAFAKYFNVLGFDICPLKVETRKKVSIRQVKYLKMD